MAKSYRRGVNFTPEQALKLDIIANATDLSFAKTCRDMINDRIEKYMAGIEFTYDGKPYKYYFLDRDSYAPVVLWKNHEMTIPPAYIDVWEKILQSDVTFYFSAGEEFESGKVQNLRFITFSEAMVC